MNGTIFFKNKLRRISAFLDLFKHLFTDEIGFCVTLEPSPSAKSRPRKLLMGPLPDQGCMPDAGQRGEGLIWGPTGCVIFKNLALFKSANSVLLIWRSDPDSLFFLPLQDYQTRVQ